MGKIIEDQKAGLPPPTPVGVLGLVMTYGGRGLLLPPPSPLSLPQIFHQGAVVTDAAHCTSLGIEVLSKQGSSVDAAVAAALCLGIVAPHSSGLGG